MNVSIDRAALTRLDAYIKRHIPLVEAMAVQVAGFDAQSGLMLTAPLAPNRNHQNSAFGGSLHGLATLSAWGLLWLLLEDQPGAHLVVRESRMDYRHAVTGELVARCLLPPSADYDRFRKTLERRGKAPIDLAAQIVEAGRVAAEFHGRFVALRKKSMP